MILFQKCHYDLLFRPLSVRITSQNRDNQKTLRTTLRTEFTIHSITSPVNNVVLLNIFCAWPQTLGGYEFFGYVANLTINLICCRKIMSNWVWSYGEKYFNALDCRKKEHIMTLPTPLINYITPGSKSAISENGWNRGRNGVWRLGVRKSSKKKTKMSYRESIVPDIIFFSESLENLHRTWNSYSTQKFITTVTLLKGLIQSTSWRIDLSLNLI